MTDIPDDKSHEPLQAVYATPDANSPVKLYEGPMVFTGYDERFEGNGEVSLEWLPSPRLRFHLLIPKIPCAIKVAWRMNLEPFEKENCSVELSDLGQTFPTPSAGVGDASNSELRISGILDGEITTGTDHELHAVLFHLANVPALIRSKDVFVYHKGKTSCSWERIILRCDPWVITLDPVENENELIRSAKAIRGYAITRIGKLERTDEKTFSLEDAKEFLEILNYLLSFAFERWCSPMLLVGLDKDGHRMCEQFGPRRVGPFQSTQGWFDHHHPDMLSNLLPALQKHWKEEQLREALKDAIYWFIEIHRQPVHIDTAIVLGQITLEMLGWLILVEQTPTVSNGGFDKLPAADKLKLLLSSCSIPISPPSELDLLYKLSKAENWQGPDCLVTNRNYIVHRNKKKREQSEKKKLDGDLLGECYTLICWYIELVLLKQLGYEGKYSNRLKQRIMGVVEPVPWATIDESKQQEVKE